MNRNFKIAPEIFTDFPDAKIGVLVFTKMNNANKNSEISLLLKQAQKDVVATVAAEEVPLLPKIKDWRDAYSKFGCKPSSYRSSVEALLRRITKNNFIRDISTAVDLYNLVSIKHQLCVGAMDLSNVSGDIFLTKTGDNDFFQGIGEDQKSKVCQGEVAYKDEQGDILCRAWNYRESDKSKITEGSTEIFFLIEGLASSSNDEILAAVEELSLLIEKYCGAKLVCKELLTKNNLILSW